MHVSHFTIRTVRRVVLRCTWGRVSMEHLELAPDSSLVAGRAAAVGELIGFFDNTNQPSGMEAYESVYMSDECAYIALLSLVS